MKEVERKEEKKKEVKISPGKGKSYIREEWRRKKEKQEEGKFSLEKGGKGGRTRGGKISLWREKVTREEIRKYEKKSI